MCSKVLAKCIVAPRRAGEVGAWSCRIIDVARRRIDNDFPSGLDPRMFHGDPAIGDDRALHVHPSGHQAEGAFGVAIALLVSRSQYRCDFA